MNESFEQSPVEPGEILLGRFRVERVLGVGGMGVVVAARHLQLDSIVAIKFLLPEIVANEEAVRRFAREARAAVKIHNEHVARVTDVGVLENGAPYMVMEYLEGSDLSAFLREQGRLSVEDSVDFILQASEAVAEAHSLGIIHRDLKPANLFLARRSDGSRIIKVLDFGISKTTGMLGGPMAPMTATASMMGSPLYMSPEQLDSARDVDVRTDIWALGIILHELLTGQMPFVANSIPQFCLAIVQAQPVPLRDARPDVPVGLETIVLRCLEKDRSVRFSSVADLASALSDHAPPRSRVSIERIAHLLSASKRSSVLDEASQLGGTAPPRVETVLVTASGATAPPRMETVLVTGSGVQGAWGHTAREKKASKTRRLILVIGASIVVVFALISVVVIRGRSGGGRTAASPSARSGERVDVPERAPALVIPTEVEAPSNPPQEPTDLEPVLDAPPPRFPPAAAPSPSRNVRASPPAPRSAPTAAPSKKRNLPGSGLD